MNTLIVYFSLEGNTDYAAKKIASGIGAELLRIKPVKEYPKKGFRKFLWGGKSAVMAEKAFGRLKDALGIRELAEELILIDPKVRQSGEDESKIREFCVELNRE